MTTNPEPPVIATPEDLLALLGRLPPPAPLDPAALLEAASEPTTPRWVGRAEDEAG